MNLRFLTEVTTHLPVTVINHWMQNEDQDIHDRAHHDDDVPVSPQSVQTAT